MTPNLPRPPLGSLQAASGTSFAPGALTNVHGDDVTDREAVIRRLQSIPGAIPQEAPQLPQAAPVQPLAAPQLPPPPPALSKARSSNAWAKDNLPRTLRDIGSAFLTNEQSFFQGLGAAGQAISNREDQLQTQNVQRREYGGPGDQFEISTDPLTGERTVRRVPEFAAAVREELALKHAPSPMKSKDLVDLQSRALYAIEQLPPEQRAAAYVDLMTNPDKYGGIDTDGMPATYDPTYGRMMSGMGLTVNQAENADYRDRSFGHRQEVDKRRLDQGDVRLDQGQQRLNKPPSSSKPKTVPPSGYLWD